MTEKTATQTFVHDVKDTATELARQNNNEFMLGCGDLPAFIRVDILRLTQILINLIGNACKFTRDGIVTPAIESIDRQGEGTAIETKQGACTLSFRVTDTGIGMSQQTMDQLFTDFSRIDPAVSRKYGGTGLGLGISQRLYQMMGSEIHVISYTRKGSACRFALEVLIGMRCQSTAADHRRHLGAITRMPSIHIALVAFGYQIQALADNSKSDPCSLTLG